MLQLFDMDTERRMLNTSISLNTFTYTVNVFNIRTFNPAEEENEILIGEAFHSTAQLKYAK